ncbi:MAG: ribose 5-phosphate isomerase B [Lachnospiraceae bacterium]|jgi:ribose 5-phosphate isomerase B|nr:ribose 5-phosphate isomerase B [Lachnospiraceae bacterium]
MIAIASDHGGYKLKTAITVYLEEQGLEYRDFGCFDTESCDYPDFAILAAKAVQSGECERGILVCTTGIGISIVANRLPGVRCGLCTDTFMAEMTRSHNDANMLAMGEIRGGTPLPLDEALQIVQTFLETPFSTEECHRRRVAKLA